MAAKSMSVLASTPQLEIKVLFACYYPRHIVDSLNCPVETVVAWQLVLGRGGLAAFSLLWWTFSRGW